jgi:hypothetical protein
MLVLPLVSCWWCSCSIDNGEAVAWKQQGRWCLTTVVGMAAAEAVVAAVVTMDIKDSIQFWQ